MTRRIRADFSPFRLLALTFLVLVVTSSSAPADDPVQSGFIGFSNQGDSFQCSFKATWREPAYENFGYGDWWNNEKRVRVMDLTGDGIDDIVIGPDSDGKWFLIQTSTLNEFIPATGESASRHERRLRLVDKQVCATGALASWRDDPDRIRVLDANGDGKDDILVGPDSNGNWQVMLSNGTTFNSPTTWASDKYKSWRDNIRLIRVMDVNADNKDDVVIGPSDGGKWYVLRSTGSGFTDAGEWADKYGTWRDNPDRIRAMDVDGDNRDDIVIGPESNGNWYVMRSTGSKFETQTSDEYRDKGKWAEKFGSWNDRGRRIHVLDANGDGKDDLALGPDGDGNWHLLLAASQKFTVVENAASHDAASKQYSDNSGRIRIMNVDGSGGDEIVLGPDSSGTWTVMRYSGSQLESSYVGPLSSAQGWNDRADRIFVLRHGSRDDLLLGPTSDGEWSLLRSEGSFSDPSSLYTDLGNIFKAHDGKVEKTYSSGNHWPGWKNRIRISEDATDVVVRAYVNEGLSTDRKLEESYDGPPNRWYIIKGGTIWNATCAVRDEFRTFGINRTARVAGRYVGKGVREMERGMDAALDQALDWMEEGLEAALKEVGGRKLDRVWDALGDAKSMFASAPAGALESAVLDEDLGRTAIEVTNWVHSNVGPKAIAEVIGREVFNSTPKCVSLAFAGGANWGTFSGGGFEVAVGWATPFSDEFAKGRGFVGAGASMQFGGDPGASAGIQVGFWDKAPKDLDGWYFAVGGSVGKIQIQMVFAVDFIPPDFDIDMVGLVVTVSGTKNFTDFPTNKPSLGVSFGYTWVFGVDGAVSPAEAREAVSGASADSGSTSPTPASSTGNPPTASGSAGSASTPPAPELPPGKPYTLAVTTGGNQGDGTDAELRFRIHGRLPDGTAVQTPLVSLDRPLRDDFRRGKTTRKTIYHDDLGTIEKLEIRMPSRKGGNWILTAAKVKTDSDAYVWAGREEMIPPASRAAPDTVLTLDLRKSSAPGTDPAASAPGTAASNPGTAAVAPAPVNKNYLVRIETGGVKGDGSDARVEVQIQGEDGVWTAPVIANAKDRDDRRRGKTDEYDFDLTNVGAPQTARLKLIWRESGDGGPWRFVKVEVLHDGVTYAWEGDKVLTVQKRGSREDSVDLPLQRR